MTSASVKIAMMLPETCIQLPLVAILRGIQPERASEVGSTLFDAGLRAIEVPLNSPQPFVSIRALAVQLGDSCLCGAGTVLNADDVKRTFDAGGRLIVAPNCDPDVIVAALELGMLVMPGIATATEAFAAIHAGATRLKLFPAATYGTRHLKALRDVLPASVHVYPVGGVGADDIAEWLQAGAAGFGFGSELFRPTYSTNEIAQRAQRVVERYRAAAART
jgi:2-dehydro-3-deoxyphosphogalactonate aldolase